MMDTSIEMPKHVARLRDFYNQVRGAGIVQQEFCYFVWDRWIAEGHIKPGTPSWDPEIMEMFGFEPDGKHAFHNLGWTEAALEPCFEDKVLEDRGEYELVQDYAGREVLFFKGRRNGFMPEYVGHPVKDMKTWEDDMKWRLNPATATRYAGFEENMQIAVEKEKQGYVMTQNVIGGYMYLRSLIGPEDLLYMFYDCPELIHECMKTWLELADTITAKQQEYISYDEIFFGEDICYNHGSLISPDMIREFLFPYYQQLINNVKKRNKDKTRKLHIQLDTDGFSIPVLDLYREIGMDYASPFEVASGCDVVEVRKKYPDLLLRGGFDKRIMAESKEAIAAEVKRIMPFMKECGGYIPCCDHGVPEEVSFENYMYYRQLMLEYAD